MFDKVFQLIQANDRLMFNYMEIKETIGYDWWLLMLLSVTVLLICHNHLFELHYRSKVWGEYDFFMYFCAKHFFFILW